MAVTAITIAAMGIYTLLGLVRHTLFRTTSLDLTLFDQAVRGMAGFGAPTSPLRGMNLGQGMDFNQLSEHFSPILALLAPLYWVHDGPETLIVAQAALFALAIVPIWRYTRRVLGSTPAYLVAIAYALSWPVARAVNFDFHEVAFAPVLISLMIERFHAGRHGHVALAVLGLALVKEDMGLMVLGFGVFALIKGRRFDGLMYAGFGLAYTLLALGVFIPALGGDSHMYWAYDHLGADIPAVAGKVITDPLGTLDLLVSPMAKIDTLVFLLWPALLSCLFSPIILLAAPPYLERMLSDRPIWWNTEFHHSAFIVAVVICAGVDGAARLIRWTGRDGLGLAWAAGACAVALSLVPRFPFDQLIRPEFYQSQPDVAAAEAAVRVIPDGVVVEAINHVGPHLSGRDTVLLWEDRPAVAPWIIADVARISYPWGSPDRQRERVEELKRDGYQVLFDQEGYVVLHRP
ncbi:hypothetical protein Acor_51870 [Acrocarpospora corrugata]|uniref:DUF2079 domain-containing protein n=1 Tax=Acrocarpospora corrugata TaxID=35763 RepID=A0A5M3W7I5_9ACTN|nr:hypothetical protein Acor_51870 [Acrocarpospora corrugata]